MISPHQIRYTLLPQEFAGNELEYFEVATADFIENGKENPAFQCAG